MTTTAIYGVGAMGEAVLAGLCAADETTVIAVEHDPDRAADIAQRYGVRTLDAPSAAAEADVHIVIVKPHDVAALLQDLGPHLGADDLVISLAAGQSVAALEANLPDGTAVVRGMPNTPAIVGAGMTAISPGTSCSDEQLAAAERLLTACGKVERVPERLQDAATAISGSGPAYVLHFVEAMIEGGVLLGMPRPAATRMAVQTLLGTATMLEQTGEHPSILRERVTSPGGTTVAALATLDAHGVRAAVMDAMETCARRSAELGG